MSSRVILWLNQSFESLDLNSQLNARLKQISELGFENIIIDSNLAKKIIPQKNSLNCLSIKAIAYTSPIDENELELFIKFHHEVDCDSAIIDELKFENTNFIEEEFAKMGIKTISNLVAIDEVGETTHKSKVFIQSPIEMNQNPMQLKILEESNELKESIKKFMKLKGNNFLVIDYPDLSIVDFLKQAKDTLNRLYFLQTR